MPNEPGPKDGQLDVDAPEAGNVDAPSSSESGSSASAAPSPEAPSSEIPAPELGPPPIEDFLGEPTRELEAWARLWTHDVPFPMRDGGGWKGRLFAPIKRLLRPLLRSVLGDLYDRQRVFDLILIENLVRQREEYRSRLLEHQGRLDVLDDRTVQAMQEVMRHNDALFARADQKLDRYRREAKDLWHRLGALVAAAEVSEGDPNPAGRGTAELGPLLEEQEYVALEARYRGSEEDIAERVSSYLPYLESAKADGMAAEAPLLDLGCGRGEALRVFSEHGLAVRGVDASSEMVARCRQDGFEVEQGDLFEVLARQPEGSLGAVVSFHVIEHLPAPAVPRLVRLAWRALRPGGVLILETPSPLALAMSARDFWMDPTHRRPIHPAHLEVSFREAGFEPVHRIDLRPFPEDQHLPEIELGDLPAEQHALADRVNRLRDLLDDLLFGERDFGLVGHKPPAP